jgi:hypothetical protein
MPDEPLPGKAPFAQRASTTARKRPGSIRVDTPVLESVTRRSEEDARAAGSGSGPGFRSVLLRGRSETSDKPDSDDPPIPAPLRPRAAPAAPSPADEKDDRWLQNWQANEIRWLNTKVEDLERQLRRRKTVSMGAVALGGLALVAAVALGIASPQVPQAVIADIEATSSARTPVAAAPPAGEPPEAAPSQLDSTPAPTETAVDEAAGRQPWRDEQARESRPSPTERAPTGAASAADQPGRRVEAQTPAIGPTAEATALGTETPGRDAERWQSEAERALMTIIQPGSAIGTPEGSERAVEVPELLSTFGRLEADPNRLSEGAAANTYAATASVNLRDSPNTEAEVLTVVGEGDRVRRLGSEGDWLLVEYGNPGGEIVTGWVYRRFTRRIEGPSQDNGPSARSGG